MVDSSGGGGDPRPSHWPLNTKKTYRPGSLRPLAALSSGPVVSPCREGSDGPGQAPSRSAAPSSVKRGRVRVPSILPCSRDHVTPTGRFPTTIGGFFAPVRSGVGVYERSGWEGDRTLPSSISPYDCRRPLSHTPRFSCYNLP